MRILAVGGGSGGHVTPVVAVLHELKQRHPDAEVRFWCDKKFYDSAQVAMGGVDQGLRVDAIMSGKLRRYNHLSLLQHLLMPGVVLPNIIDSFKVLLGTVQSVAKLVAWRPDVMFLKGGFVCLPVGWAARLLRVPYIIHDSDAHPGLTNRLLAKGAQAIATGAPLKYYSYPDGKASYVGIPVGAGFRVHSASEQTELRRQLELPLDKPVVVVTGGGLGATRINDATIYRQGQYQSLASLVLVAGALQYDQLRRQVGQDRSDFRLYPFVAPATMQQLLAAADVVVTRAGATTMLELAALGKATVMVPNARLTAGHQVKNAKVYADGGAAIVVEELDDGDTAKLADDIFAAVQALVEHPERRKSLEDAIQSFARPDAARAVVDMIDQVYSQSKKVAND